MTPAIGVLFVVMTGADNHVEPFGQQQADHRRRGLGIIGQVAVGHQVNIGIDVGEHSADDVPLALLPLGPDDRSARDGDFNRPIAAVVIVDVDRGGRERCPKTLDRRADRGFLVEARQKDSNARRGSHSGNDPLYVVAQAFFFGAGLLGAAFLA